MRRAAESYSVPNGAIFRDLAMNDSANGSRARKGAAGNFHGNAQFQDHIAADAQMLGADHQQTIFGNVDRLCGILASFIGVIQALKAQGESRRSARASSLFRGADHRHLLKLWK